MFLPRTCPACGRPGAAPCADCRAALRPAPPLEPPPGVAACAALFSYEGTGALVVRRLKYANHRDAVAALAPAMAALVGDEPFDDLSWVPTTPRRRRERGFDQAQVLARAVGRHLGVRPRELLGRSDDGSQTGRHGADRWAGPDLAARRAVRGTVLVVDDVRTTGASLAAAAATLRGAGADRVVAVTLAATPAQNGGRGSTIEQPPDGRMGTDCADPPQHPPYQRLGS